jgi:hypothetical protein
MAQALEQNRVHVELKIYDGANHDTAPSAAIADVFAFFARHVRK